jgi:hypothetical protein
MNKSNRQWRLSVHENRGKEIFEITPIIARRQSYGPYKQGAFKQRGTHKSSGLLEQDHQEKLRRERTRHAGGALKAYEWRNRWFRATGRPLSITFGISA